MSSLQKDPKASYAQPQPHCIPSLGKVSLKKSFKTAFCFLWLLQLDTTNPASSYGGQKHEFKMSAGTCSLYRLWGKLFLVLLLWVLAFLGNTPISSFTAMVFVPVFLSPLLMRTSDFGVVLTLT